jgi:uncharacterized lipoprotein YmbA
MYYLKAFGLTCLFLGLALTGCVSLGPTPDSTRFFVLAALPRSGQRAGDAAGPKTLALGIGPVRLPGYLDRQQIVTRISQNRFAVAENDRWAEPLEENFSRVLAQNLSILLQSDSVIAYPWPRNQSPTYQVQLEVFRFEANAERLVELWSRWSVLDAARKVISTQESYLSQRMKDNSTEAAVAALSGVTGELSKEIAAAIGMLMKRPMP